MSSIIHPTAIIHPDANLGENVYVGPYAVIEQDVVIGDDSRIESHAQVLAHTSMGKGNRVFSYASVGGEPQDLKYHGEFSRLVLGDNNRIREYVTINRGTEGGGGVTQLGSNCLIMAYSHVAHDCILGNGVILSNGVMLAGHVVIGDGAVVGGMCGVHQFGRIGDYAFLGAMSGTGQDLPPYMLGVGNRAKISGPNLIGLRRQNVPKEAISALKNAYKIIWRSEIPRQDALESVEREYGKHSEIQNLLDFIRASERGVMSGLGKTSEADGE